MEKEAQAIAGISCNSIRLWVGASIILAGLFSLMGQATSAYSHWQAGLP